MIEGVTYSMAWSYDAAGRLHAMTYPDGDTLSYRYDEAGRIQFVGTAEQPGVVQPGLPGW